jgi:hypothetical protein
MRKEIIESVAGEEQEEEEKTKSIDRKKNFMLQKMI